MSPRVFPRVMPSCLSLLLACLMGTAMAQTQPGEVAGYQKISMSDGGLVGPVADFDRFGASVGLLGDVDGDGVEDVVVGADLDDDGGADRGAVWVLFLNTDGTVKAEQKISATAGNLGQGLAFGDRFGFAADGIGDLDGDGVPDMVVGAPGRDDGADDDESDFGAVYIIFLNTDGTAKAAQRISAIAGGWPTNVANRLEDGDEFGTSVAGMGDFDLDGLPDIVVGAKGEDDGVNSNTKDFGAIWQVFLNVDGTVKGVQKISNEVGGFGPIGATEPEPIKQFDAFGAAVVSLGDGPDDPDGDGISDLDGDGIPDLAVSALGSDDGAADPDDVDANLGAVWIILRNANGTTKAKQKISATEGDFDAELEQWDNFGSALASPGDVDGDGVLDLIVGAHLDDDGGEGAFANHGALYVLYLNTDGTVKDWVKIADGVGNFTGELSDLDSLGRSAAAIGDLDDDGVVDVLVGSHQVDRGGVQQGAVWNMFLSAARWTDLASGLAGTNGTPQLTGRGALKAGHPVGMQLTNALANAYSYVVVGIDAANLPFYGGTLVPDITPPGRFFFVFTGPLGTYDLEGVLTDSFTPDIPLYIQVWVVDPGAVEGFAASNAVVGQLVQ